MSIDSPAGTLDDKQVIAEAEAALDGIKSMRTEIGKVIFGQEQVIENARSFPSCPVATRCWSGCPGLAKTKLVDTLGTVLGLNSGPHPVHAGPDAGRHSGLRSAGGQDERRQTPSFRFVKGPIFSQLLMADEINRASPRTQSALLQAMQE